MLVSLLNYYTEQVLGNEMQNLPLVLEILASGIDTKRMYPKTVVAIKELLL